MIGVLDYLLAESGDRWRIETSPDHVDGALGHCVLDCRRVSHTSVHQIRKLGGVTPDVVPVAAELQLVSGVLVHHEGTRPHDRIIQVLHPIRVVDLLVDYRGRW